MEILYLVSFLLAIPIIWKVLMASRLEACFKQGEIWAMRVSYFLITLIGAHLVSEFITTFITYCQNLIK